jgi:hypothetical protein
MSGSWSDKVLAWAMATARSVVRRAVPRRGPIHTGRTTLPKPGGHLLPSRSIVQSISGGIAGTASPILRWDSPSRETLGTLPVALLRSEATSRHWLPFSPPPGPPEAPAETLSRSWCGGSWLFTSTGGRPPDLLVISLELLVLGLAAALAERRGLLPARIPRGNRYHQSCGPTR